MWFLYFVAEEAKEEQEEKRPKAFRIPKKGASKDPPSDAESFSSISSDGEPAVKSDALATLSSSVEKQSSFPKHSASEKSHKSSSSDPSSQKRDKHSSSDKSSSKPSSHSSKHVSGESSTKDDGRHHSKLDTGSHQSSDKHRHKHSSADKHSSSDKDKHSSSDKHKHSSSDKHKHSSSDKDKNSSSDKHKHSSSDKDKNSSSDKHKHSSSDKHRHSSSEKQGHSSSDRHKHSSEKRSSSDKLKPSSERDGPSSSKSHKSSSDKDKTHSRSGSSGKAPSSSHEPQYKDITMVAAEESSGYITSPDLTTDEEDASPRLPPSHNRRDSAASRKEESAEVPVTLTRHHLKPTVERQGGSLEERQKMLAKLQAIREQMMAREDTGPARKRAARGEVKKRRAKREKLEGDFTGSCLEKIEYDEEEKPSLKRPEVKPEEPKPPAVKEKRSERRTKERSERSERRKSRDERKKSGQGHKSSREHTVSSDSKLPSKVNRFDAMREKPKLKPKPRPRPPPVNFADLIKMAEQKQAEPVIVEVAPKKEKERRPMTQEEIDRKRAREERLKTKDYKDWYKFGEQASKVGPSDRDHTGDDDSHAGGFLRRDHNIAPTVRDINPPKPSTSGQHSLSSARPEKADSSSFNSRPSSSQAPSKSRSFKPQPHPTRPGMIANKPHAMAQHFNNGHKDSASGSAGSEPKMKKRPGMPESRSQGSPRDDSPQRQARPMDKTREGNTWDSLFSRPEYKKLKTAPGWRWHFLVCCVNDHSPFRRSVYQCMRWAVTLMATPLSDILTVHQCMPWAVGYINGHSFQKFCPSVHALGCQLH